MIELLDGQLSVDRCLDAVRGPGSGGIVIFIGSVRDLSEGKKVERLEYDAYGPMAVAKLEQVMRETRERWPVQKMAIQHRVGRLEIGEDAVVIAVACPHRAEGFQACRYAIDRLKEIVPIWKKEFGEGGEVWIGGPTPSAGPPDPARD
jgi:molybdopterin synthase catalytic subunit